MMNIKRNLYAYVAVCALAVTSVSAPLANAGTVAYTYDDLGRVSTATYPNGVVVQYQYDAADNRTYSGAPSATITVNVTSSTNLRTLANSIGYSGQSGVKFNFVVPSGTTITGPSGNGASGIATGTWPSGTTLSLSVSGKVYGGGGAGGAGAVSLTAGAAAPGVAGSNGGDAIYVQAPVTITIASGAALAAGGS